jgi:hypothetical protein
MKLLCRLVAAESLRQPQTRLVQALVSTFGLAFCFARHTASNDRRIERLALRTSPAML